MTTPDKLRQRGPHTLVARFSCAVLLLCGAQSAVAAKKYVEPDPDATRRLVSRLVANDCPGAIAALKDGVKAKQPDVLLLGGNMFEAGTCVKQDWEKAVNLYQLADAAGNKNAIARLAAGYAIAGRENGVALWWASQLTSSLPTICTPADQATTIEAFEAKLAAMSPSIFKACVYIVGVYSAIMAEARYPASASPHALTGEVSMDFIPSRGVINWTQGDIESGTIHGVRHHATFQFDDRKKVESELINYLRDTGKRALTRYQKPDDIDPDARIQFKFVFVTAD